MRAMSGRFLYVFLDEAGNFDFSPGGTKYFILSAVSKERPFQAYHELTELKYNLVEGGKDIEYFHAQRDNSKVRNRVFHAIETSRSDIRVDAIVAEKAKTYPSLRPHWRFYPRLMAILLNWVFRFVIPQSYSGVYVFMDYIKLVGK